MRKRLYYLQIIILLSLIMILLFERTDMFILISAPLISMLVILYSERFLLHDSYYDLFYFNVFKSLKYFMYLLVDIYCSGVSIIPTIIKKNDHPVFVEIYTDLESNLELLVLCNSITLTPGTITVDLEGHRLLVLWMNPTTDNVTHAGDIIKGKLERRIQEGL